MATTLKNTFRKHEPKKKARKNPDLLNVRHERVYELTDVVECPDNPLAVYISEDCLKGMCIGLAISLIPLMIINFLIFP